MTDERCADAAKQSELTLARFEDGKATLCVLGNGAISIEANGFVIVKTIGGWHMLGAEEAWPYARTPLVS